MVTYARLLLATGLLLLAGCSTISQSSGSKQSIAVTIPYGSRNALQPYWPRPFTRRNNNFYVLLTNVSSKPVRVWQEWCSWGYYSLQLEVFEQDGTEHLLKKKPTNFLANFPDFVELEPGGSVVWKVDIEPSVWEGLSWLPTNRAERVKLKAIYKVKTAENDEDNRDLGVDRMGIWTGTASSKLYDFVRFNTWSNTALEPTPTAP
jgi:hypothetical protein